MKKNKTVGGFQYSVLRKILMTMRLTMFLILISIAQVNAGQVHSESSKLTLKIRNSSIENVLFEIEKKTDYVFVYSKDLIDVNRIVDVDVKEQDIDVVLSTIFFGQDVRFQNVNNNIIISPKFILPQGEITITGKIIEKNGDPLPGVNVFEKSNPSHGVITSVDGTYSITVSRADAILVCSFVGFETQELHIANRKVINVTLLEKSIALDEVVSVGYGTMKKRELTCAVSSVKSDDFVKGAVTDAAQLIQGKVAGLSVIKADANPVGGSQIVLRGITTLSSGSSPLVIIDGVPGFLSQVAPEDIESIDVLKDGSAAAIYGTRGTNGVLLITTRKVKGETPATIEANSYFTTQAISNKLDFMNADGYRKLVTQGKPGAIDYGQSTNWIDEIFRTPLSQVHNVSLRGGKANTNYIANINYKSLEGIMNKSDNNVFTTRLEANHSMFDGKLKVNVNIMGYEQKYFAGGDGYSFRGDVYRNALIYNPTDPVKDENGDWTEHVAMNNYKNPVALIEETNGENKNTSLKTFGTISYRPVSSLTLKLLASHNTFNSVKGYSETQKHISNLLSGKNGFASRGTGKNRTDLVELTAQYIKSIKDHDFTLLGGYSWQEDNNEFYWMNNWDFPSDLYSYNNMGAGAALSRGEAGMSSNQTLMKLIGYFFRVNYNFNNKYMLMASIRHEGSSKFGEDHKWGNFPAVSAGWNIINESFLEDVDILSELKLRAGFGITGTAPSAPYMSLSRLSTGSKYLNNGTWMPALLPSTNANPDLRWETKEEFNFGMDFGILNNRILGSFDYYVRTTNDMLWNYNVPNPPYLYNTILANAGTMENKGFEAQIKTVPVKTQDLVWNSTVNFSTNKNKLVSLSNDKFQVKSGYFYTGHTGEPIQQNTHRVEEGEAIGNFWGYKSVDIDENGHWIIEGKDGNPKPIAEQQPDDKQVLGNGLPKYYLSWDNGIVYKNFDANITMRGAFGYQILNSTSMFYGVPVSLTRGNVLTNTYDNIYGKRPLNDQQELQYLSYFVEDGDFWKIDNITIGYSLKLNDFFIKNLRFYVSGSNLITFTSYSGIDPEVNVLGLAPGVDERDRYPSTRSFTVGLSLKF